MRPGAPRPALVPKLAPAAAGAASQHAGGALLAGGGRALQLVQLLGRAQLLLERVALQALQRGDVGPAGSAPARSAPMLAQVRTT